MASYVCCYFGRIAFILFIIIHSDIIMSEKEQSHIHESVEINSVILRNMVQEYRKESSVSKEHFLLELRHFTYFFIS